MKFNNILLNDFSSDFFFFFLIILYRTLSTDSSFRFHPAFKGKANNLTRYTIFEEIQDVPHIGFARLMCIPVKTRMVAKTKGKNVVAFLTPRYLAERWIFLDVGRAIFTPSLATETKSQFARLIIAIENVRKILRDARSKMKFTLLTLVMQFPNFNHLLHFVSLWTR